MYYQLDENGYLCAYSFDTVLPGGVLYRGRVPEDFDEESFDCWKIEEDTLTLTRADSVPGERGPLIEKNWQN